MDEKTAAIYDKFRHENWNKMTFEQRLETLQELEMISAAQNNSKPQNITAKELEGATYGYYDGNGIVINKHILENGVMVKTVTDETTGEKEVISHTVQDANIQMMDTVFHEDFHAFQEQAVNGEIPKETLEAMGITDETLRNWQSNNTVMNYVDPEVDGCLYRIQGLEESAFRSGESKTQEAFSYLNEKYGQDPNYGAYVQSINNGSYAKNLNMAQMRYGDMDIENTLQGKMNERYHMDNVQYSNKYSAEDVEEVLDKSMFNAMKNKNGTNTGSSEKGGLGHSNHGGFGGLGSSHGSVNSNGAASGGKLGVANTGGIGNGTGGISNGGISNGGISSGGISSGGLSGGGSSSGGLSGNSSSGLNDKGGDSLGGNSNGGSNGAGHSGGME